MTNPDACTPRTLVRYTLYTPESHTVIDHVAYEALQPSGTVSDGEYYDADVIGYAECEPYANIGRERFFETFREAVESNAAYVHWKSPPPFHEATGDADRWAAAHAEITDGGTDR